MSDGTMGSASALPAVPANGTPAEADQWEADAIASIGAVSTPEDAETLLARVKVAEQAFAIGKLGADRERRWKTLRLKAERRYGELLPPKQQGKRTDREPSPSGGKSKADERAQTKARKVAEVPEPEFIDYVENELAPTREGLLRKTTPEPKSKPKVRRGKPKRRGEPTFEAGNTLAYDDEAIKWVRDRLRQGWTRQQIMDATKADSHGWPRPGRTISSERDFGEIRIAIYYTETARQPRLKPKESGKRLRQLHDQKREGRTTTDLWHLQVAVAKSVAVLEGFDLPELDWSEYNEALVSEIYDDLERNLRWTDTAIDAVTAHMDDLGRRRKITMLDARANDPSSTVSERANAARLAERLRKNRPRVSTG